MQQLLKTTGAYQLLKKEEREGFSHAYLLVFDDARFLSAALKCFAKLLFRCDEPTSAKEKRIAELIDTESFSDCVFFPEQGKKLTVEDAEKIVEESTLAPVEGDVKAFVLGDFAEANVQTQNKLLKLLEEPPKGVVFLLGTTSVFPVLPTVLSRTKKMEILSFSLPDVTACLGRIYGDKYDEQTRSLCAAAASGRVGEACALLEGGYYATLTENAFALTLTPLHKLPALVKQIGETPYKKELLSLLRLIFRDALVMKTTRKRTRLLLQGQSERIEEVAGRYELNTLLYAQKAISEAEKQIKFNAIFSQCIEICVAKIINHKL